MTVSHINYEKPAMRGSPAVPFQPPEGALQPRSLAPQQTKHRSYIFIPKSVGWLGSLLRLSSSDVAPVRQASTVATTDHVLLARASVLQNWDGTIPRRQTRGLAIKKNLPVDICDIVDSDWFQAHYQGLCGVVPRAFLKVLSIYDEQFRSLFPSLESIPVIQKPPQPRSGPLPSLSCFSVSAFDEGNSSPKPPLPPPPFAKEAHEAVKDGSRLSIAIECQSLQPLGIVITLVVTLTPALGTRYTGFTLNAVLPTSYRIVGISPKAHKGHSTATRECRSETEVEVDRSLRSSSPQLDPSLTLTEKTVVTRKVEYTRVTKSRIQGGGINTSRATWVAQEDVGGKSGLEEHMELKILLQASNCPPMIKYMYTLETEGGEAVGQIWTSSWIGEALP